MVSLGCALIMVWIFLFSREAVPQRPNIILVMTDDQGLGDTGYNGHPDLKTPNLDKMSREGMTFNSSILARLSIWVME